MLSVLALGWSGHGALFAARDVCAAPHRAAASTTRRTLMQSETTEPLDELPDEASSIVFGLNKVCTDQLNIADGLRALTFWLDKVYIDQLNTYLLHRFHPRPRLSRACRHHRDLAKADETTRESLRRATRGGVG